MSTGNVTQGAVARMMSEARKGAVETFIKEDQKDREFMAALGAVGLENAVELGKMKQRTRARTATAVSPSATDVYEEIGKRVTKAAAKRATPVGLGARTAFGVRPEPKNLTPQQTFVNTVKDLLATMQKSSVIQFEVSKNA